MFFDNQSIDLIFLNGLELVFKLGFVTLVVLYFIFALIVVRQVNLMAGTVLTEGAPILKILAIANALLALGVIILFIGFL